jgi:sugar/nucleoside kinase (ribokinase family)
VLCAGNLVYDILARPVSQIRWGATSLVDSIEHSMGGNGASTAYTLGKLGVRVRLVGMVGQDTFGDALLARLAEAHVDTSQIGRSRAPTSTTVALVATDGARAFLHRPGSSAEAFSEPLVFPPLLSTERDVTVQSGHWNCRFRPRRQRQPGLIINSYSRFHLANPLALPRLRSLAAETLRRAREAGLATSLDTGWDARGEWIEMLAPCLPFVDLLFVNHEEARMFTGRENPPEAAAEFRSRGVDLVIVKLGGAGCTVFSREGSTHVPAFQVEAVDSTGAGDCFAGAFLAALEWGHPPVAAARFANAVGAMSVQHIGATTGIRSRQETLDWIAAR